MDEQNSDRLLKNLVKLRESALIPDECLPILDVLDNFNVVKESCFSWDLKEDYRGKIEDFTVSYMNLQCYSEAVLGIQLTVTWKVHVLCAHLTYFLTHTGQGLAPYAEQTGESVHAKMKSIVNRHKRKLEHPAHDIHQHRAVVKFSGNNI